MLHPGETFTLVLKTDTNDNIKIDNNNIFTKHSVITPNQNVITFLPLIQTDHFQIILNNTIHHILNISLHSCDPDKDIQTSKRLLPVYWSLNKEYGSLVTHYQVAVCVAAEVDGKCKDELLFINLGNSSHHHFQGIFPERFYRVAVRPCFGQICLQHAFSNGIWIETSDYTFSNLEINGRLKDACIETTVSLNKYKCTSRDDADFAVGYRWAYFADSHGNKMLSDWHLIKDNDTSSLDNIVKAKGCPELAVYSHRKLCVCLEAFCVGGNKHFECTAFHIADDPNIFNKDILYDLNMNEPFAKTLENYAHTENLGDKLSKLHESEMDFVDRDLTIGGFMIGEGHEQITWYLMKKKIPPVTQCSYDPSCLVSRRTTGGLVSFGTIRMLENGILYICAVTVPKEEKVCSDGFLIDDNYPQRGIVKLKSFNGFVVDGSELFLHWSGFHGNMEALTLGYLTDIASYQFAIGTSPGLDDVVKFSSVGLSNSAIVRNLHLRTGHVYYATVRAYNHLNRSVEACSEGVVFDNTPPTVGSLQVESSINYFVPAHRIAVHWADIEDKESGIDKIEIGIGSSNNSVDICHFLEYVSYAEINQPNNFQDGHEYFAILKATNGAGLSSFIASPPFVIDSSAPEIGHVMDVTSTSLENDVDYQQETNTITASWYGFSDSHSGLTHYKIGLGTSPYSDDVFEFVNVGLQRTKTWRLSFIQGVKYYTSVIACNGAGLCSKATSNGLVLDNSAPVPGIVVVGDPGTHSRYLPHRNTIHASWIGFEDPHSGIDHFDVCIGSSVHSCDIMERMNVQLSLSFLRSNLNMTTGNDMVVTVRACNKVDMCTQRSSPIFVVDNTAPVLITKPEVQSIHQDISGSRQVISDPSFFKVSWLFNDAESPITRTTLSVCSANDSHVPVDDLILSNENEFVIRLEKQNILRQGDIYIVRVTACNAADLCETATSNEILVDSSPPQIGGFMPPLQYQLNTKKMEVYFNLTWYGFVDVESDIRSYFISIGYSYSGTEVVDGYKIIPQLATRNDFQTTTVTVRRSSLLSETMILTIWAENFAGLTTPHAKVTADVLSNDHDLSKGNLVIQKHSCLSEYCNFDCTCAVVGQKCKNQIKAKCIDNTSRRYSDIFVNITLKSDNELQSSVGSSQCLAAVWDSLSKGIEVLRFEYSFGRHKANVGDGVYNLTIENPWNDVGMKTKSFHCLSPGKQLEHNTEYVAYVRAWTSFIEYTTFTSDPVQVDHTPPDIHKKHFVVDTDGSCNKDLDYITSSVEMAVCWDGVFSDDESGIKHFMVSLGTSLYIDDVVPMQNVGTKTFIKWSSVSFKPGTRYYATVRAINSIGLQSERTSDGFVIDNTPPIAGVVYNTKYHSDIIYQSLHLPVQFSWHGFEDEHSFIDFYMVGFEVISMPQNKRETTAFANVGLLDNVVYFGKLNHNDKIIANVKAVDKAGHESLVVKSMSLTIDDSPPESFICVKFESLQQDVVDVKEENVYRWSATMMSDLLSVYKIQIQVQQVRLGLHAYMTIADMEMLLPFAVNADGSLASEYKYLSKSDTHQNISITVYNLEPNSTIDIMLAKCSQPLFSQNKSNVISAQQISGDSIGVYIQTADLESGIQKVLVGVGTTEGGLEIQTLQPISSNFHDVIHGNFTHKMKIYVKAEAVNHAGLRSEFESTTISFDKTPPVIQQINVSLGHTDNNYTMVVVKATWNAVDEESSVKYCEFCLGISGRSCDVLGWTNTEDLFTFVSPPLDVKDGTTIHGTVRCINQIQLTGYGTFSPLFISYLPPKCDHSELQFISDRSIDADIQQNAQSLTMRWDECEYPFEPMSYSAKILQDESLITPWMTFFDKNYLSISQLQMNTNKNYTVIVEGTNIGGISSEAINKTITISTEEPLLTGSKISVRQLPDNGYVIDWSNLFKSTNTIISYEVSVGSVEGNTDILMPTTTQESSLSIYIPDDVHESFIVVRAVTITGKTEIYRDNMFL